ncbi:MAG: energy transducer TonB [Sulfuricurvum sp.]|uniref:energy transducer TonB n=1 Tax=Sulfuricurvum sp. TaxID=2025608 RepID=UPI0027358D91|nr:energy transducer TonB [Sulfuricurvum sp.]MDP3292027.1 energy transducer TonB [Sulfuricurvum sp.]
MKTKRYFLLSVCLHAVLITGAVALSSIPEEEKEEEIILELSMDASAQESPIRMNSQPASSKLTTASTERIEKTEITSVIKKEEQETIQNEAFEEPKPIATAHATVTAVPLKEIIPTPSPSLPVEKINAEEEYLDDHLSSIRDLLLKYRKYPSQAARLKQEGVVKVTFRLKQNGEIEDIRILGSSGYDILDSDAMALIQKTAEYFPKPPKTVRITVPLNYALKVRT